MQDPVFLPSSFHVLLGMLTAALSLLQLEITHVNESWMKLHVTKRKEMNLVKKEEINETEKTHTTFI